MTTGQTCKLPLRYVVVVVVRILQHDRGFAILKAGI